MQANERTYQSMAGAQNLLSPRTLSLSLLPRMVCLLLRHVPVPNAGFSGVEKNKIRAGMKQSFLFWRECCWYVGKKKGWNAPEWLHSQPHAPPSYHTSKIK